MTNFVFIAVAIIGTAIATYTDVKTRLIPDWISYFMLAVGLCGNVLLFLTSQSYLPILYSFGGAGAFFSIGYLLYRIGFWGGGDTKLLTALGSLLAYFPKIALWPFLVSFWLNLLLFGAIFGVFGMLFLLFKNWAKVKLELNFLIQKYKVYFYLILLAIATFTFIAIFERIALFGLIIALLSLLLFVLKATEIAALYKKIKPSQLVEGDWIIDEIKVENYYYKPKKIGVEQEDIVKMIELEKLGKLKEVKVKDGLAYVPAFFVALLVTFLGYDVFFIILSSFF